MEHRAAITAVTLSTVLAFFSSTERIALVIAAVGFVIAMVALVLVLKQATRIQELADKVGKSGGIPAESG